MRNLWLLQPQKKQYNFFERQVVFLQSTGKVGGRGITGLGGIIVPQIDSADRNGALPANEI